jgi:OmpA-OmpF porin, OOP family
MYSERLNYKCQYKLNTRLLLIFIILFMELSGVNVFAAAGADISDKKLKEIRKKAERFDRDKDVFNAIAFYGEYLSHKPGDIKSTYRLASLYFNARDYVNALEFYNSVINLSFSKYPMAYYYKGLSCMSLQKYDEAITAFGLFKKYYRAKKGKSHYRKLALIYSANAEWAKNSSASDGRITVVQPGDGLNHSDIDVAPFPVNENTIFYSTVFNDESKQFDPIRQIYKAVRIDGKWRNTGLLEGEVNDPDFNTGNAALTDDGQTMYFTRSRRNWKNENISEIFVSHFQDNRWQKPEKLPYPVNNENNTSTQPAIGRNLRTGATILYFVSDRPGGRGGMDIWVTEYNSKTGTYRKPSCLPNKVNTPGDECSPFYDISTQNLYFSSNGMKNGLGGFDIYKTTGSARKWTVAEPLPKPINSPFDDYFYSVMSNKKEGFFASNRPGAMGMTNGTCCDDIFTYRIYDCVSVFSHGNVRNEADDKFYRDLDEKYHLGLSYPKNNSALPDVPVELYLSNEQDNEEILVAKTTTDKNGNYSFDMERDKNYKVLVRNYGFLEKTMTVSTLHKECSDTISIGTTLIKFLPKVSITLNIYYDFNDFKLSEEAKRTIDRMVLPLFDLFPSGIIEIGSHTDGVGSEEYNQALSQKRSESVVSYLISRGISGDRLVAKGYGMSVPVAPNINPDGSDNPEGRKLNRRTEFKVVGEVSTSTGVE